MYILSYIAINFIFIFFLNVSYFYVYLVININIFLPEFELLLFFDIIYFLKKRINNFNKFN